MTSEAVVSLFTASLAATERALAEESAKALQAESALVTALTRIHKLEVELLLARAESAQWRNRYARECEQRAWERERRELQRRGPVTQQSGADNNPSTRFNYTAGPAQAQKESEEAQEPQEPSPRPATPLNVSVAGRVRSPVAAAAPGDAAGQEGVAATEQRRWFTIAIGRCPTTARDERADALPDSAHF
ncbi:hypothetical protein PRIPAC_73925 [Pristionchus pacificus]|uniref:Uncharacterized protein n=1 Tax=Pristionchus pacificus TaxID=54126 RepID=A0A2A6C1J7_PRIPA|nr:hypothetical protein PRIPAC_73925 [Pristionchus pacificus]|eukprot:PDM71996.1 hypothetical protein PRIPAC_38403 [Pristionchus pacificus]